MSVCGMYVRYLCVTFLLLPIFSKYTFFQNVISGLLGQSGHIIPTFYSQLNENREKICFFHFMTKRECFGGINMFIFGKFFCQNFFQGLFLSPLQPKIKILRCTFFHKLYMLFNDI